VLIAIEGIDGAGKGTQAARLVASLQARGRTAALFGFPRYGDTFFGARVGEFLNGRFGALDAVHPLLAACLFAGDRWESRGRLEELRSGHDFVVLDRYVASNIAHQAAKCAGDERARLANLISHLEFDVYGLPRADRVVLLDLPAEQGRELIARKVRRDYTERAADLQEADLAYQSRVRELYLQLSRNDPAWRVVPVTDRGGSIRTIDDISADVLAHVLDCDAALASPPPG
jgi:dTMP kinase